MLKEDVLLQISLDGVTTLFSSSLRPRSNFKHFHSFVMFWEEYLAKCSNLFTYYCTVMSPCYNARNSASLSCLAVSRKYFSRKRALKLAQDTSSSLFSICCCIPAHQYSASPFSKYAANNNFMFIFAVHYFEYFLTLAEPCIRFIGGRLASELKWACGARNPPQSAP